MGQDHVEFDSFRNEWPKRVRENNPSTVDLGRRFSHKLLTQWLDLGDGSDDPVSGRSWRFTVASYLGSV